jgi:hypothetical protein
MAFVAAAGVLVACGGDDPVQPDPAVAPFVGTWDADSLTITNTDPDTTIVANILEFGSFFITVEESGQYTATLTFAGSAIPEIGQLSVSGSTLTMTPSYPAGRSPATSTYSFSSDDYLIMDGPTEFDFNLDGTPEDAEAHFELQRR